MKMKAICMQAWRWLGKHWRGIVIAGIVTFLSFMTLSLQLSTLVEGTNPFEKASLTQIQSAPLPWERAVNAPYFVPAYIAGLVYDDQIAAARFISVMYGLIATACLFYVIKFWFNTRYATIAALIFITSSWVLHITHMAAPLVLLMTAPLLILASLSWLWRTKKYTVIAMLSVGLSLVFAAYVPYMPWLIGIGVIFLATLARERAVTIKPWQWVLAGGIATAFLWPLLISLVRAPGQLLELFGLSMVVSSLGAYLQNMIWTLSQIFFYSQPLAYLHLGRLPWLDVFLAAMMFFGIYYYAKRFPQRRSLTLFSSSIVLVLVVPLTTMYQEMSAVLIPIVYIYIISGIVAYMKLWLSYFPRNPWARNVGTTILVIAIGLSAFYQLQRYFIAWPQAESTRGSYTMLIMPKTLSNIPISGTIKQI